MSSLANRALKGSTLRVLQTIVSIGIGFWMLPFLFNNLGQDQYAVWVLIGSVVATFYLLDLGFSQAVTRYVARHIYDNNYNAANRVINTSLVIYSCLAIIVFLTTLIIASLAPNLFKTSFNDDDAIYVAVLILGVSLALEFPAKAFPGIISAYMRYDTIAKVRIVITIFKAILIYIFISDGYGIIALASIMLILNLCSTAFFVLYSQKLFKEISYSWMHVKKEELHEIFHFSKWVFVTDTAFLLKDKLGLWIIAAYSLTPLLPIFYAAQRLTEYASQFLMQALGITSPIFTKFYAEKNTEKMLQTLSIFVKLYALFSMIIMCGFIIVGKQFLEVWMGDSFDHQTAYECLIFLSMGAFFTMMSAPYNSLLMTLKKHKYAALMAIIEIGAALATVYYIMPEQGLLGVAIATGLVIGIIKAISLPCICAYHFNSASITILIRSIACFFLAIGSSLILIEVLTIKNTWISIIYNGAISTVCSLIPGYLIFNKDERYKIKSWLTTKTNRKNSIS